MALLFVDYLRCSWLPRPLQCSPQTLNSLRCHLIGQVPSVSLTRNPALLSKISPSGVLEDDSARVVGIEDYERTLAPALIGYYERNGYCWVVSGTTQSGRAFADPRAVPEADYDRAFKLFYTEREDEL